MGGEHDDDFEDEDETAIEPRLRRGAPRSGAGPAVKPGRLAVKPAARNAPLHGDDDDDDEATELADRSHALSGGQDRRPARGGVGRAVQLTGAPLAPNTAVADEATEWRGERPPGALPQGTPRLRPAATPAPAASTAAAGDGAAARPRPRSQPARDAGRPSRANVGGPPRRPVGREQDETSTTMPVPVVEGAAGGSERLKRGGPRGQSDRPAEQALDAGPCDFVVDAPDGAVVFVDGRVRGRGPSVKVEGISRASTVMVRIEAPGHHPWSGTVELAGRAHVRIRPALKKRET